MDILPGHALHRTRSRIDPLVLQHVQARLDQLQEIHFLLERPVLCPFSLPIHVAVMKTPHAGRLVCQEDLLTFLCIRHQPDPDSVYLNITILFIIR